MIDKEATTIISDTLNVDPRMAERVMGKLYKLGYRKVIGKPPLNLVIDKEYTIEQLAELEAQRDADMKFYRGEVL